MFMAMFIEEVIKVHPEVRYILLAFALFIFGIMLGYHIKEHAEQSLKDRECSKQLNEIHTMLYTHKEKEEQKEVSAYEELLSKLDELEFNF